MHLQNEFDKLKTCWFIIVLMVYSGVSIYLTARSYGALSTSVSNFSDVTNNWQAKAIMNIMTTSNFNCPSGYEDAYPTSWAGTADGCFCGNVSASTRRYWGIYGDRNRGTCNYTQLSIGCKQADAKLSTSLNYWSRVDNQAIKVCIQRSQETWAETAPKSGNTCPQGTKKCGFSQETTFCTKEAQCPINDIQLVTVTLPDYTGQIANCTADANCTIYSKSSDSNQVKLLKYKRGDSFDALPLSQFRFTEYTVCSDSTQDNVTPNRNQFWLMNKAKSSCSQDGVSLWNLTDTITEGQLFYQNGLSNTINYLLQFGYYDYGRSGSSYNYNLYSRNYIPWNVNCRGKMGQVINNSDKMQGLRSVQGWLCFTTVVAGIFMGIILPIMLCNAMNNRYEWFAPGSFMDMRKGMRRCGRTFNLVVKIAQLPFQLYALFTSLTTKGFFTDLASASCSNSTVNQTLNTMGTNLALVLHDNLLNLGLLFVMFGIGWCFFLERVVREGLKDNDSESGYTVNQPIQNVIVQPVNHVIVQQPQVFSTATVIQQNPGYVQPQQFPHTQQFPQTNVYQQGFGQRNVVFPTQNTGFPNQQNTGFPNQQQRF